MTQRYNHEYDRHKHHNHEQRCHGYSPATCATITSCSAPSTPDEPPLAWPAAGDEWQMAAPGIV